jgi:hypothetical protein
MSGYGEGAGYSPGSSIVEHGSDRVRAISVGVPAASGQILNMAGILLGWSIRETSGTTAASFDLFDGHDQNGALLATSALAAGGESQRTLFSKGVPLVAGLYFQLVSGAVKGVIYVRADVGDLR